MKNLIDAIIDEGILDDIDTTLKNGRAFAAEEYLKKSNEDFEISNDYLEGKKEYEQMDSMEKADIDFINRMFGGL